MAKLVGVNTVLRLSRFLAGLTLWLPLAVGYTQETKPARSQDPEHYYSSRDSLGFRNTVRAAPHLVRRQVIQLIDSLTVLKAADQSRLYDSLLSSIDWLIGNFESESNFRELRHRRNITARWSATDAALKLRLDSQFLVIVRSGESKEPDEFSTELRELRAQYEELADSCYLASIDQQVASRFQSEMQSDSAKTYYRRAIALSRAMDQTETEGLSHLAMAGVLDVLESDFDAGEREHQRAMDAFLAAGRPDYADYALSFRAHNLFQLSKTYDAIDLYRELLVRARGRGDNRLQAECQYMLAECYYDAGELDSALQFAQHSMTTSTDDSANLVQQGFVQSCLGLIYQAQGRMVAAERAYVHASRIFDATASEDGELLNRLRHATFLVERGQYADARAEFSSLVTAAGGFQYAIMSRYGLGLCDFVSGDYENCCSRLGQCVSLIENGRMRVALTEARSGMLADKIDIYRVLTGAYVERWKRTRQSELLDSALWVLERSKAKTFRELLAHSDRPLSAEEDSLLSELAIWEERIITRPRDSIQVRKHLIETRNELERSRDNHPVQVGKTGQQVMSASSHEALTAEKVRGLTRELIGEDQVLLEYCLSRYGSYVFVISRGRIDVVELDTEYTALVDSTRKYVGLIGKRPGATAVDFKGLGRHLYDQLLPLDVRATLGTSRILVSPSGILHRLPFEALVSPGGRYLIEDHVISYAPSLASLESLTRHVPSSIVGDAIIVIGAPDYSGLAYVNDLRYSMQEVDSIVRTFGASRCRTYTGSQATEPVLKALDLSDGAILHFSAHATADERHPERSYVQLGSSPNGHENGRLTFSEIANLSVGADLVFLSSCETGGGHLYPGEGVLSLARPFLIAGSRSAVVTLWRIDDRSASEFVAAFYQSMRNGRTSFESLAHVKRKFLAHPRKQYQHPYFWAPFVVIGASVGPY